ncbi:hypothetical protein GUITHDRAFT_39394, partial [Guillardia theta CCMP2712]
AIEGKSLECVKEIFGRGADVNSRQGKSEVTPLLLALSLREESIASYLLERNADVFRSDADGTLPLHMAAAACHVDCVKVLIEHGANVDQRDSQGWSPL